MIVIVVIVIICLIFIGLGQIGENMEKSEKIKRDAQIVAAQNELDSLYNELYGELKQKYDEYLRKPEFEKQEFPTVITEEEISLSFENVKNTYSQKYDVWKNDKNLCCITNLNRLHQLTQDIKKVTGYDINKSQYQRENELRERFKRATCQVYAFFIPLSNIEYFSMSGQKYATTEITGGGGTIGGSSVKGAIAGGIVAGGTGAIIGSRKESTIEPIRTETRIHDETEVYIKYKDRDGMLKEVVAKNKENENGLKLPYSKSTAVAFFDVLKKVIPEKEYTYIMTQNQIREQIVEKKSNIEDRLVKTKELLEKGLISQEEYEAKRKDILSEM